MTDEIKEYVRLRREALLSMDEAKIRRFMTENSGGIVPEDPSVFWIAVHKARTAAHDLPEAERLRSHQWLTSKGMASFYAITNFNRQLFKSQI
jgi:hypothetical protein